MNRFAGGRVMYLISYDITNTKIRNKIAKTLEGYGRRVQYSVFECDISQKQFENLYQKLMELMQKEKEGNIRIYQLCTNCMAKLMTIGIFVPVFTEEEENLFII